MTALSTLTSPWMMPSTICLISLRCTHHQCGRSNSSNALSLHLHATDSDRTYEQPC
jgi:hypothetical protein